MKEKRGVTVIGVVFIIFWYHLMETVMRPIFKTLGWDMILVNLLGA